MKDQWFAQRRCGMGDPGGIPLTVKGIRPQGSLGEDRQGREDGSEKQCNFAHNFKPNDFQHISLQEFARQTRRRDPISDSGSDLVFKRLRSHRTLRGENKAQLVPAEATHTVRNLLYALDLAAL